MRGRLLFILTYALRLFFSSKQIHFGSNVRLQRLTSLMAEKPQALINIGDHSIIYEDAKIEAYGAGQIHIGQSAIIGRAQIFCKKKIHIGSYVVTSWNIFIQDYSSHPLQAHLRQNQIELMTKQFTPSFDGYNANQDTHLSGLRKSLADWQPEMDEIFIGNNVWIGANSTILQGAHIEDNCIIAAHSVVLKGHYPAGSTLAGVPAKVIKSAP